ncbi:hypothetical protein WN944_015462 [Citrus x changshan-huyou]|uniref:Uncharacterized protein n=1 Tax=Citrus x changshan-huyou TaxID=2935761 RepID=A0AAP0ME28_9ROSI
MPTPSPPPLSLPFQRTDAAASSRSPFALFAASGFVLLPASFAVVNRTRLVVSSGAALQFFVDGSIVLLCNSNGEVQLIAEPTQRAVAAAMLDSEEQADLQQALELQSRRLVGLQLLDVQKHHPHRDLSTGNPISSPTHSPTLSPLTFLKRAAAVYGNRTSIIYEGTCFNWLQLSWGLNGEKRKRNDDRVVEKPREVIHVRTKKAE